MKVERIVVTIEPWTYGTNDVVVLRAEAKVYPGGLFTSERAVSRSDVVPMLEILMGEVMRVLNERLREHLAEAENGPA